MCSLPFVVSPMSTVFFFSLLVLYLLHCSLGSTTMLTATRLSWFVLFCFALFVYTSSGICVMFCFLCSPRCDDVMFRHRIWWSFQEDARESAGWSVTNMNANPLRGAFECAVPLTPKSQSVESHPSIFTGYTLFEKW